MPSSALVRSGSGSGLPRRARNVDRHCSGLPTLVCGRKWYHRHRLDLPWSHCARAGVRSRDGADQSSGDGHPRASVIASDGIAERHYQSIAYDRGGPHVVDEPARHR